jgi:hypothetical protein
MSARRAALLVAVLGGVVPVFAIEDRADAEPSEPAEERIAYKFTPTAYFVNDQRSAFDLNLRGNRGPHTAWLGHYQRGSEFQQARLGYERQFEFALGRVIASAQYATRGFWGGAVTLEAGKDVFGLLGWGRTNLKPYFNLNFDPNDSVLFGGGVRLAGDTAITLFQVRDDRLATGQRISHLVFRTRPSKATRLTVDVFHKSGWRFDEDDPQPVRGTGVAVTYDYERYFARAAWDPQVNFTRSDMLRLAVGLRF